MLKGIALGIAALATTWLALAATQAAPELASIIRTQSGLRFEVPPGWEWTAFNGYRAILQHVATKSGEKSPNGFSMSESKGPDEDFDTSWNRLDRNERRTFPNGATARWKAGLRWIGHPLFHGEIVMGSKVLSVGAAANEPGFDLGIVEAAFLQVAASLRDLPATAVIYHPSGRFAAGKLNTEIWHNSVDRSDGGTIIFACYAEQYRCGAGSDTQIRAYRAGEAFADTSAVLADITGFYVKAAKLKIGPTRQVEFPGGEALWTEQPGRQYPFLGAVKRDGRYFFVQIRDYGKSPIRSHDALREDFLAVAKSVRAWDGN